MLDLHLPDLTGEEVLRLLRKDPRTEKIPVTVLSADATPDRISSLKAAGAREYLTKPLDVRHLIELLEGTLQGEESATQPASAARSPVIPRNEPSDTVLRWTPETVTLRGLAGTLIEGMRRAIQDGHKDRLDELIAAVAAQDPHCAGTLKNLADNYEYDALTTLLTEVHA